MTRYRVMREVPDAKLPDYNWRTTAPHSDAPADGFASALEAEAWLHGMFLSPHIWRVEPYEVTE